MEEYAVTSRGDEFARSRELFEAMVVELSSAEAGAAEAGAAEAGAAEAGAAEHGDLEVQLTERGRELQCTMLQDHLNHRAAREERVPAVTGADGVVRRAVERGHDRPLATVFGEVRVSRLAYRTRGAVTGVADVFRRI